MSDLPVIEITGNRYFSSRTCSAWAQIFAKFIDFGFMNGKPAAIYVRRTGLINLDRNKVTRHMKP